MQVRGLKNLGHSCFLNSVIQALVGIEALWIALKKVNGALICEMVCQFVDNPETTNALKTAHSARRLECTRRLLVILQQAMYSTAIV